MQCHTWTVPSHGGVVFEDVVHTMVLGCLINRDDDDDDDDDELMMI